MIFAAFLLVLASGIAAAESGEGPRVKTGLGMVDGVTRALPGTTLRADSFLGVPYAEPPVGNLRWRAARAAAPWKGVLNAAWPRSVCVQASGGSEDCLYLNIHRPSGMARGEKLPVAVYVHGGANIAGGASGLDASRLAAESRSIIVVVQYRLGAFGFLYIPELGADAGNFGVSDIRAALLWVRRNIAAFGGDAGRTTLIGQSSGASNVCRLMVDESAKGLFDRAVLQSENCMNDADQPEKAVRRAKFFTKQAGCGDVEGEDAAACLRKQSLERLAGASASSGLWAPVSGVTGWEDISEGKWNKVPLLLGTNRDEGRSTALSFAGWGEDAYRVWAKRLTGEYSARVLESYPPETYEDNERYGMQYLMGDVLGDSGARGIGGCGTLRLAEAASSSVPVWFYTFEDRRAPAVVRPGHAEYENGASHGSELPYFFPDAGQFLAASSRLSPAQTALARVMRGYWGNFIASGDPNGKPLPPWRQGPGSVMALRPEGSASLPVSYFSDLHKCSLWNSIPPVRGRISGR